MTYPVVDNGNVSSDGCMYEDAKEVSYWQDHNAEAQQYYAADCITHEIENNFNIKHIMRCYVYTSGDDTIIQLASFPKHFYYP